MICDKRKETAYLRIMIILWSGTYILMEIVSAIAEKLAGYGKPSERSETPYPFFSLTELNKGDIVSLRYKDTGINETRVYLGYKKISTFCWLYFFDAPGNSEVLCFHTTNANGYDCYPTISWRVIGMKKHVYLNDTRRKKIKHMILESSKASI